MNRRISLFLIVTIIALCVPFSVIAGDLSGVGIDSSTGFYLFPDRCHAGTASLDFNFQVTSDQLSGINQNVISVGELQAKAENALTSGVSVWPSSAGVIDANVGYVVTITYAGNPNMHCVINDG